MRKVMVNGMNIGFTAPDRGRDVSYNNTTSGLLATDVQSAIDELNTNISAKANDVTSFSEASTRENIASGETHSTIFGKIKKFFSDLKTVAFSGSYTDLDNQPTIPAAVAVKGNAETDYRTGNVNLTPSNIGTIYANSGVTINSLNEFVALLNNSGGQRSFCVTVKINSDIGVGVTGWQRVFAVSQNGPNNQSYSLGMFCLFFPADTSTNIKWALIDGHTDGAYTISGTGTLPYTDHTYSAGTGIGLSNSSFYLSIPRVAESCNALPGAASLRFREYLAGSNYNLPSNAWYQILEIRSTDTNYGTQLALGMTTDAAYYRKYSSGSWGSWKSIINTDTNTTYSGSSTVTLSGTTFSLTKANVTTALGYTPPTDATEINYSSGVTVKDAIDGKVSKSGDTMTGLLAVNANDGTTSTQGTSIITLGNNIPMGNDGNSSGVLTLFGSGSGRTQLWSGNHDSTAQNIIFPDKNGTIALTNDFDMHRLEYNTGASTIEITNDEVTIGTPQTVTLKKGNYLAIGSVNATWTNHAYQFGLYTNIGSARVGGASYAGTQSNSPCLIFTITNVPSDGDYSVYISGQTTNAGKVVSIPSYQSAFLVLIKLA